MRVLSIIFLLLSINLYADSKWIPLEPLKSKQINKPNTQLQELQPVRNMLKKAVAVKHLLDTQGVKDETNEQSEKNWFTIK